MLGLQLGVRGLQRCIAGAPLLALQLLLLLPAQQRVGSQPGCTCASWENHPNTFYNGPPTRPPAN